MLGLLIISCFANYKLLKINSRLRELIPHLLKGEEIKNFDLLDKKGRMIDPGQFENRIAIFFIFLKGCSPCDKNIVFWKKIAKLFKDKASVYGVIIDTPTAAFNFADEVRLNFDIYVPDKLGQYVKDLRLSQTQSQTIVCKDKRVELLKTGILESEDAIEIINKLKWLLQ